MHKAYAPSVSNRRELSVFVRSVARLLGFRKTRPVVTRIPPSGR